MAVDKSGILWFGGQGGAYRIDDKALTTFTSKEGLLDDFVGSMIVDRAGNVWMGHPGHGTSRGGASRYDGKSFTHFTEKDGLNSGNVYAMLEDSAGNIWFGSVDAGACRYDGKTFTNFSAINPPRLPEQ
jgi:ligand-binding sensor domain-containing protein